jgi:hypothetical protein
LREGGGHEFESWRPRSGATCLSVWLAGGNFPDNFFLFILSFLPLPHFG